MSFRPFADVWMLARPKVKYFGAYPAGFLMRARDMLCVGREDQVLHVCSGRVRDYRCGPGCKGQNDRHFHGFGPNDITMDLDPELEPDILGDARNPDDYQRAITEHPQIQAALADPPYMRHFAREYKPGEDVFPTTYEIVKNSLAILPVGGRVGILSLEWPRYPKSRARQIGIFGVTVGNGNLGRWYAVFEKTS